MNLSQAVIARSDQLNADDLVSGPRTFTVKEVRRGDSEQPVAIELVEFPGRPFKPSKTVLRILAFVWGEETDDWPQPARFTLFRDADVKWAGQAIGGIRVSHMSHMKKQIKIALAESKGKKTLHTVEPLPDAPPPKDWAAVVATAQGLTDADALMQLWSAEGVGNAPADVQEVIKARGQALRAAAETSEPDNSDVAANDPSLPLDGDA